MKKKKKKNRKKGLNGLRECDVGIKVIICFILSNFAVQFHFKGMGTRTSRTREKAIWSKITLIRMCIIISIPFLHRTSLSFLVYDSSGLVLLTLLLSSFSFTSLFLSFFRLWFLAQHNWFHFGDQWREKSSLYNDKSSPIEREKRLVIFGDHVTRISTFFQKFFHIENVLLFAFHFQRLCPIFLVDIRNGKNIS